MIGYSRFVINDFPVIRGQSFSMKTNTEKCEHEMSILFIFTSKVHMTLFTIENTRNRHPSWVWLGYMEGQK